MKQNKVFGLLAGSIGLSLLLASCGNSSSPKATVSAPNTNNSTSNALSASALNLKIKDELSKALEKDEVTTTGNTAETQGLVGTARLWNRSRISVCWLNPSANDVTERAWMLEAVKRTWQRNSQAYFVDWGTCSGQPTDIRIQLDDSNPRSFVGTDANKNPLTAPTMWLNTTFNLSGFEACKTNNVTRRACIEFIAVHEFGHALGFEHEQKRADTPASCIQAQAGETLSSDDVNYGSWDINSVMNYCNPTWNNFGRLSSTDTSMVRQYYKSPIVYSDHTFDALFYMDLYPDVSPEGDQVVAEQHWKNTGMAQGKRGSMEFDPTYYLNQYSDIRNAYGEQNYAGAISHWTNFGIKEGRRGSLEVDVQNYINRYSDLKNAFGNDWDAALNHWQIHGVYERRIASDDFNLANYTNRYPDLQAAYAYADTFTTLSSDPVRIFDHWVRNGKGEGRKGS